ncbi:putative malonic semialdehyde reductase RutE [Hartmannibacter diazotrophicus]|uniref:Putative NADH dehydrogenase/NAD(P)H nitroreductase HDIA_0621 n=1 Tax=Hartmannibacter diazotrophicus TaxID=1482074 RepID=A0A2C9D1H4_9HYPH|nr:malonic semialdehyde reductase [Hartmannibacter diazotrophicus]SON54162.1 putative malonic semialdehyde reductase RutE [Hartmannibacter diazotrophicus]
MDAALPKTRGALDATALDVLFREARTHNAWLDKPVPESLLKELAEIAEFGPTAINALPARFAFVQSRAAKEKLKPTLSPGNVDKTMSAPVTVIAAYDTAFYDHLPKTFPHADMKSNFVGAPEEVITKTALQSATLQAGYLILAARALGLDTGPMGGFDAAAVDAAFFEGTTWKSFLLINLGYGDAEKLFPRNPRLELSEFTQFL